MDGCNRWIYSRKKREDSEKISGESKKAKIGMLANWKMMCFANTPSYLGGEQTQRVNKWSNNRLWCITFVKMPVASSLEHNLEKTPREGKKAKNVMLANMTMICSPNTHS